MDSMGLDSANMRLEVLELKQSSWSRRGCGRLFAWGVAGRAFVLTGST
jgi:hypothetical protein